jgi:hypothetical protein
MNEIEADISTSVCRYCRFYQPKGRRGGSCQKLGVPVDSKWKACTFASSPFRTTATKLEEIFQLNAVRLADNISKVDAKDGYSETNIEETEQIA